METKEREGGGGEGREHTQQNRAHFSTSAALTPSSSVPGIHYPLPPGYRAYLLPPVETDDAGLAVDEGVTAAGAARTWAATASWPAVTAWALDAVPGAGEPSRRALDWITIAEAAAGHVRAGEVEAAMGERGGARV